MRYVLLALLTIGMMTYAVIDCVRTDDSRIRLGLPHWFWVTIIIVLPFAGALTWLIASGITRRKLEDGATGRPARSRGPVAPDDDPDFLFRLERERRRAQKERDAREAQTRRPATPPAAGAGSTPSAPSPADTADDEPLYVPEEFVVPDFNQQEVTGAEDADQHPEGTDDSPDERGQRGTGQAESAADGDHPSRRTSGPDHADEEDEDGSR